LLGLLHTDGYVSRHNGGINKYTIELTLNSKDIGLLEYIKARLGATIPIRQYRNKLTGGKTSGARLTISNKRLWLALIKFGFFDADWNKSINILKSIPEECVVAFWRGIFDGDGHISKWKSKYEHLEIGLTNTKETCESFKEFASCHVENGASVRPHSNGRGVTFKYTLSHKKARLLLAILYTNSSIALERKKTMAVKIINAESLEYA
jgi:hypothetical protein